jgi:hypothetical protein
MARNSLPLSAPVTSRKTSENGKGYRANSRRALVVSRTSRDKNLKESLGCEMCSSERATRCFVGVARNQPNLTRDPLANYFAQWSVSPAIPNKDRFPDFS